MKKLLMLSAVAIVVAGTTGCCHHKARRWFNRGAVCTPPVVSGFAPATGSCPNCNRPGASIGGGYFGGYVDGNSGGCSSCQTGGVPAATLDGDYISPAPSQRPIPEPDDT